MLWRDKSQHILMPASDIHLEDQDTGTEQERQHEKTGLFLKRPS